MLEKFAIVGSAGNSFSIASSLYPEIIKSLSELGLTHTSVKDCEGLIFINYHNKSFKEYKKFRKDVKYLVLIRLEPIAVFPRQYTKSIEDRFDLVIDPGKSFNQKFFKDFIGWPYKYHHNPASPSMADPVFSSVVNQKEFRRNFIYETWEKKRNKLVLVAANKVAPTAKSNYKLRRRIAKAMNSSEIDVYGDLWRSTLITKIRHRVAVGIYAIKTGYMPNVKELYGSLFTNYSTAIGAVPNKHIILAQYKYCLVVENSSTYCSEKLFDAILNGCIPIYIGPKNYEIFLPENLFHWSDGSLDDIRDFIGSLTPDKIKVWLKNIEDFITSPTFIDNWGSDEVYSKIATRIFENWRRN